LTGITAAVVGVIANLAVYFATHTLFAESQEYSWGPFHLGVPDLTTLQPLALLIGVAAMMMIFKQNWSVLRTLGVCAVMGLIAGLVL
jgi:chromate transporter